MSTFIFFWMLLPVLLIGLALNRKALERAQLCGLTPKTWTYLFFGELVLVTGTLLCVYFNLKIAGSV